MVKVLGLLVALAAMMAQANAALLARYDFADASATLNPVISAYGGSASSFGGSAGNAVGTTNSAGFAPDTSVWRTKIGLSTGESNTFSVTAGTVGFTVNNILFNYRRQDGLTSNVPGSVSYVIGSGAPVVLDPFTAVNGVNTYNASGLFNFVVGPGETVTFSINYENSTNGVELGFVELQGVAVPEPASMAIFGLMGAGLAVRRFRRK
jgi:hypothetical protein